MLELGDIAACLDVGAVTSSTKDTAKSYGGVRVC